MANHLRAELVTQALNMALGQRQPIDVIHHSDQGSQYTLIAFSTRCRQAGVRPTMGSVGDYFEREAWPRAIMRCARVSSRP